MIGWNIGQGFIGLAAFIVIGYTMKIFNIQCCQKMSEDNLNRIKFVIMITFAIGTPIFCHIVHLHESKYIGIITYGYVCHRVWGHDNKPDE